MVARIQILRSGVAGNRPTGRQYGEPYVNVADNQLGIMNASNVAQDLLGVPMFSASTSYTAGNAVNYQGRIYIALGAVAAGAWNSAQWAAVASLSDVSSAGGGGGVGGGLLKYSSATALSFAPFRGNSIKINGSVFPIPTTGIVGLSNTSVFVNGVAAQNLAASTRYFVYAFMNSGVVTADFSATGHATSSTTGNEGVEIKSGDDTRSLIGQIRTNASSQFVDPVATPSQQFIRSWFNENTVFGYNFMTASISTSSGSFIELWSSAFRAEFLSWNNDIVEASFFCPVYGGSTAAVITTSIGLDGVTPLEGAFAYAQHYADIVTWDSPVRCMVRPSEGYHYACVIGRMVSGTTANWWIQSNAAGSRPTLNIKIQRA